MEREYPVPGYEKYFATKDGNIISYAGRERRELKTFGASARTRNRKRVRIKDQKQWKHCMVSRTVLSAKIGRPLEPWEQACHIDGDPTNDAMDNLEVGCFVNNAIDCLENGKRQSSVEQIKRAIKRLKGLLKTLDK